MQYHGVTEYGIPLGSSDFQNSGLPPPGINRGHIFCLSFFNMLNSLVEVGYKRRNINDISTYVRSWLDIEVGAWD